MGYWHDDEEFWSEEEWGWRKRFDLWFCVGLSLVLLIVIAFFLLSYL